MARNIINFNEKGQTPLDDISGLLVKVETRQELNDLEFKNNNKAYKKYFLQKLSKKSMPFNYESFKQVHKEMFGEVWQWAGVPRDSDLNLGVPKEKIGAEIHRLLYELNQWESQSIQPLEIAVRIHHRLALIHPFNNGNGRWARMITNLYLHQKGLRVFQWPNDSAFIKNTFRPRYLEALKNADHGNFEQLLKLHEEYWKTGA